MQLSVDYSTTDKIGEMFSTRHIHTGSTGLTPLTEFTYLSCSCVILVGQTGLTSYTVNPIRPLYLKNFLKKRDEGNVKVVPKRTGFVGFSRFLRYSQIQRPVLPVTEHQIGLQGHEGRGLAFQQHWLRAPDWAVRGLGSQVSSTFASQCPT